MKKTEVQARVLDSLVDHLESGHKDHVNLLDVLDDEIKFKELRAAVYYLSEMGYIEYDESVKHIQGFYCRITKEGIKHHQDIFEEVQEKSSIIVKFKTFFTFFESARNTAITVITIIALIFGVSITHIAKEFPVLGNFLGITTVNNNNSNEDNLAINHYYGNPEFEAIRNQLPQNIIERREEMIRNLEGKDVNDEKYKAIKQEINKINSLIDNKIQELQERNRQNEPRIPENFQEPISTNEFQQQIINKEEEIHKQNIK